MPRSSRFARLAFGGALAVGVYVLWSTLRLGGEKPTVAFEDGGQALAGLVAAAICALAARRASGHHRTAWWLLGGAALSWSLGEVIWTVNELGRGISAPFPSLADAGFLAAIPLEVAGVLFLSAKPDNATSRYRAVIEGAVVASALLFCAWAVGLDTLVIRAPAGQVAAMVALAYPSSDIIVLTLLVAAFRQVPRGVRPVFLLLGCAFTALLVADSAFGYLELGSQDGSLGSIFDAGRVAGFIMLGLAALVTAPADEAAGERPVTIWQRGLPWIAMLIVIGTVVYIAVSHRVSDARIEWIAVVFALLFVLSQVLALNDSLQLLVRSRRAETMLGEQKALLDEVIGRAPLGIARVGDDFRFIAVNPRLCELLAAPERTLLGSSMRHFLPDDEGVRAAERMALMRTGQLTHVEVDSEMVCADGRRVWVHRIVTPVLSIAGRIDYYLVMFEDMTEKHNAEQAAVANFAALERINRLKSEFMSMVSHEFRTALTGIQGYSELMSSEEVSSEDVREFAGDINSDALRLNRMITEMLDLDRIESGRMAMHMEPTDLNRILTETVERAQMSTSKHEVIVRLDPKLPRIDGDTDRLTQVVANLLTNAVKYAPEGGEILVTSQTQNGSVEVSVQDHGLGIPPEFISRIFGRYERYEGDGKSQVVGTGLGLAIAQQIIQLHKGRIWVESLYGQGSTFRFTIPAANQDNRVA
ncbi:MAG: PAS domain S-box protein [Chloroflexi bacterium]|nr:MAG: PAS domain S-box protein [Chloroflexota bacterium]